MSDQPQDKRADFRSIILSVVLSAVVSVVVFAIGTYFFIVPMMRRDARRIDDLNGAVGALVDAVRGVDDDGEDEADDEPDEAPDAEPTEAPPSPNR